jgi:hypothetical protein
MTTNRRLFITTGAAGLAGISLVEGQSKPKINSESKAMRKQMRQAIQSMRDGKREGLTQYAFGLRVFANQLEENKIEAQLQVTLRKLVREKGRAYVLAMEGNHTEMQRIANEFGADILGASVHTTTNFSMRERILDSFLSGEGVVSTIREVADALDSIANKQKNPTAIRNIQLGGEPSSSCNAPCDLAEAFNTEMDVICGLAFVFPIFVEACAFMIGVWLGALGVCLACKLFG